ncbi:MAG: FAD-binding protein [Nocardioidaceae bacterium]|nr:FAD-binding protein [Nocardioidaceae bacterium]
MTATEQVGGLLDGLRRAGVTDVDASTLGRALYSCDASLYRVVPAAVVRPRHTDEVLATMRVAAEHALPITSRGAGTSCAGNAIGTGVVIDFARYLTRVVAVRPDGPDSNGGRAVVEPGVVHAALQREALARGLRFGPDPSTHTRCTLGGMIGNNACGSRALGYGRTVDNVLGLDVVTGDGERLLLGEHPGAAAAPASPAVQALHRLAGAHLELLRTQLGRFGRQVSGYGLEHLLPEAGGDVARSLVGSEGSLAVVLGATVRLVHDAPHRLLVVLGYPSMADAADAVPAVLAHAPVACEGLDARIIDVVRARRGASALPPLPRGTGWLFVEVAGVEPGELAARATALVASAGALGHQVVTDPVAASRLWRVREDGAGLAAGGLRGRPAHAGWEDAAVPPDRLGDYLRAFEALVAGHDLLGIPYGHFGDGCVHVRLDFPLAERGGERRLGDFVTDAARLVASYGGSLSGEHGDGRARSELLPLMYGADVLRLFAAVKQVLDPGDRLNPGIVVRPRPVLADLRPPRLRDRQRRSGLWLAADDGPDGHDLGRAAHRCTGVGKCLATPSAGGTGEPAVMCPSYVATRDEKDSTRGRARVLQEMVDGSLVTGGWGAPEVHAALDLCLACKACANECPTGVDMATYKAEVLHRTYRRRLRPRSHYTLGQLPRWTRLAARAPRLANVALMLPATARLGKWAAGVDQRRSLPRFAAQSLRRWARTAMRPVAAGDRPRVVVWGDTFTDSFHPEAGRAAVAVLTAAGYAVEVLPQTACCGLTWITTGQLDGARRVLRATVRCLGARVEAGELVLGLEPSCTAVLRDDAVRLLSGADRATAVQVAGATRTLAELLAGAPHWRPPDLTGTEVVVQPHCHHTSVLGWAADAALLSSTGATVHRVGGCCGLAGNFGVEIGHHDVSVAIAEAQLLPAVRAAPPGAVVLADGFSCRTQLVDLAGVRAVHLAELLARAGDVPTAFDPCQATR